MRGRRSRVDVDRARCEVNRLLVLCDLAVGVPSPAGRGVVDRLGARIGPGGDGPWFMRVPSPSVPSPFDPQHQTSPLSVVRAHVNPVPTAISLASGTGTTTGAVPVRVID